MNVAMPKRSSPDLEMKISYLATHRPLGPMIGLVGTVWGMIMSFQEIATAAGSQPRPEKVAEGISTALFITLEGITLSVPAIFFFCLLPQPDRPDDDGSHQGRRPHDQLAGRRGQERQVGLIVRVLVTRRRQMNHGRLDEPAS